MKALTVRISPIAALPAKSFMVKNRPGRLLRRSFLLALVVSAPLLGSAPADDNSSFVSEKLLHVAGGAGISVAVGYSTRKPWLGLASGCAAGVAKEVHDNFVSNETFAGHMRDIGITCGASTMGYFLVKRLVRSDKRRPEPHLK